MSTSKTPFDAVVREVAEETGYVVEVEQLLGVDSRSRYVDFGGPGGTELHSVGVFYRVGIRAGQLRHETGGSTDLAAWIPLADIPRLERAVIIEVALEMHRAGPMTGHVEPMPTGGLVRH